MSYYSIVSGAILGVMLAWFAVAVIELRHEPEPVDYALVQSVSWEYEGRVVVH